MLLSNPVALAEKVDGANLGISLTKDYKVLQCFSAR